MITFGTFANGGTAQRMTGMCTSSPDFLSYTNGAIDQLLRRGKWWATFRSVKACVYDGCVTWPRHVQTILAINGGRHNMDLFNQWYSFLPMDHCGYFYRGWNMNGRRGPAHTVIGNTSPVFSNIPSGDTAYLQFYIDSPNDAGKTITVCGIDGNGQIVRSQRSDGTIQEGVQLQLQVPYVQTPFVFRHVTRVNKDLTTYPVRGYQLSTNLGVLLPLAYYEPSEVFPAYTVSKIGAVGAYVCATGQPAQIEALIKIKFTPIMFDNDPMLIDNEAAVCNMIMAQRQKEAGDLANARAYEGDAFRELNFQMKDYFPDEQFVVDFQPFGKNGGLNRDDVRIGML